MNGARPALLSTSILALALLCSPAVPVHAGWSMFHGNRAHTGLSNTDAPYDSILAWMRPGTDSIFSSSPVIGPTGTVYVGTLGKKLLAISPTGSLRWSFVGLGNFRHSTPAVSPSGRIYIGDSAGRLYAVNPNGSQAWFFQAAGPIKTSPNLAPDGTIYFGADDGKLYAVSPTGTLRWSYTAPDTIRSSPALGPDGTIYFGCEDQFLYALRPDGALRWRVATGARIKYCAPAVSANGTIYIGSYDQFLYAFNAAGGFLWAFPTTDVIRATPAIGADGTVYVGSGTHLYAISPTGTLRWQYDADGDIQGSPAYVAVDDVVCFGDDAGVFHVLHAADANTDWTARLGSPIQSSPAPDTIGNIYVAEVSGNLWSFGTMPTTAVDPSEETGAAVQAIRAWPNPSGGAVSFEISGVALPSGSTRRLIVLDAAGRLVTDLPVEDGHRTTWDGRDRAGRRVAPGVYMYRLEGTRLGGRLVLHGDSKGAGK